jgi:hypothetical protein
MIVPGPTITVVSVTFAAKFALAVVFAFKINVHVVWELLGQTPLQFTNVAFAFGVAVSVIVVLFASDVPVGLWVTVPGPLAVTATENLVTVVAPVPVSVLVSVNPFGPLTTIAPARPPTACGENVRVMEHDEPAGIGAAVQVSVCEKSPGFEPPISIDVTTSDSVALGPFCSWMISGEEEPRAVSGNKIGVGATRIGSGAGGGGASDVPEIASVRVAALVSMVSVPVKVPTVVGAKFTTSGQDPPGAIGDVHVSATEKLGSPVTAMLLIVSGP